MYLVLSIVTGGLVSIMIQANGELQAVVGAVPSLITVHLVGLATIGAVTVAGAPAFNARIRQSGSHETGGAVSHSSAPRWFLAAGILGVVVVFMSNEVYSRGGVVLTLMGTLAGQALAAALLERSRFFDGRKSPVLQRVLSLVLILPGAAVIGLWSGVGPLWVFLSWLPGGILMFQSMMNSRNALRYGQRRMVMFNYLSALSALALLTIIDPHLLAGALTKIPTVPVPILFGGGLLGVLVVGFSSFLLNRASAMQVVLGLYAGQISVGILLDALSDRPLALQNVAGVAMVVAGLVTGEVSRYWARSRRAA